MTWTFSGVPFRWNARSEKEDGWILVPLSAEVSDELDEAAGPNKGGFGSIKVRARVGTSSFATSVFPSTEHGAYVLPLKKAVRSKEGIEVGRPVEVLIELATPEI